MSDEKPAEVSAYDLRVFWDKKDRDIHYDGPCGPDRHLMHVVMSTKRRHSDGFKVGAPGPIRGTKIDLMVLDDVKTGPSMPLGAEDFEPGAYVGECGVCAETNHCGGSWGAEHTCGRETPRVVVTFPNAGGDEEAGPSTPTEREAASDWIHAMTEEQGAA